VTKYELIIHILKGNDISIPPSSILKQSYKFKDEEAFSGYRAANQEPISSRLLQPICL
jgi:hypothetical protein